jgi:hypothetical protein
MFKQRHQVTFIPSRVVLREKLDYDPTIPLERDSLDYLKRVWPKLPATFLPGTEGTDPLQRHGIDWNGNGVTDGDGTSSPAWTLEGDQCLVFFLGGIPHDGGPTGFSKDPFNPAAPGEPRSMYFEFPKDRLQLLHASPFLSFADPWRERPYLYFRSHGAKNGYMAADCVSSTGPDFTPYQQEPGLYYQPTGYQIISAGRDRQFGTGGVWVPDSLPPGGADGDNLTSFHAARLSAK